MLPTKIWEFKHKKTLERQRTSDGKPPQKWVISRTNMQPKQNYTGKDEISKTNQMKNFGQYVQYIPLVVLPLSTIRIYFRGKGCAKMAPICTKVAVATYTDDWFPWFPEAGCLRPRSLSQLSQLPSGELT